MIFIQKQTQPENKPTKSTAKVMRLITKPITAIIKSPKLLKKFTERAKQKVTSPSPTTQLKLQSTSSRQGISKLRMNKNNLIQQVLRNQFLEKQEINLKQQQKPIVDKHQIESLLKQIRTNKKPGVSKQQLNSPNTPVQKVAENSTNSQKSLVNEKKLKTQKGQVKPQSKPITNQAKSPKKRTKLKEEFSEHKKTNFTASQPNSKGHQRIKSPTNQTRSKFQGQGKKSGLKKRRIRKAKGIIFIQTTQNNTIVTLTDMKGNARSWASGGTCNFNGSRRSTPFAAKAAAQKVAKDAISMGLRFINVQIKGIRRGKKKNAVKGLAGLKILRIQDTTSIPHNGCRAPKKRRT